jgi:hypothetical protein
MMDDKIHDAFKNSVFLARRFVVCVDDKIDNKNHNIYCMWMKRFIIRFIVCENYYD